MSIKQKLFIAPFLIVLIVSILTFISKSEIGLQINSMDEIYNKRVKKLEIVSNINNLISNVHLKMGEIIISAIIGEEVKVINKKFEELNVYLNSVKIKINELLSIKTQNKESKLLKEILEHIYDYENRLIDIVDICIDGDPFLASENYHISNEVFTSLKEDTDNLISLNKQLIFEKYEDSLKSANKSNIFIFILSVIIGLISILISVIIIRHIIESIAILEGGLFDFFKYLNREEKTIKEIEIKGNNEFSNMAKVINKNVKSIKIGVEKDDELIKETTSILKEIRKGSTNNRISKVANNPYLNRLKNVVNEMLKILDEMIKSEIEKSREKEEILIQQSKMAAMGDMIGNIAHQWRQPLNALGLILQKIELANKRGKLTTELIENSSNKGMILINKMSTTIDDFRNFFKPNKIKEEFYISKVIDDSLGLLNASFNYHHIKVNLNIENDVLVVGYPNEFSQVILNILNNSKDVLLEKNVENKIINIHIYENENKIITIEDNGGGIAKHIMDRVFEPYFSTKTEGKGTGIGLYMSKIIIEEHMKGKIEISNSNIGAKFKIIL